MNLVDFLLILSWPHKTSLSGTTGGLRRGLGGIRNGICTFSKGLWNKTLRNQDVLQSYFRVLEYCNWVLLGGEVITDVFIRVEGHLTQHALNTLGFTMGRRNSAFLLQWYWTSGGMKSNFTLISSSCSQLHRRESVSSCMLQGFMAVGSIMCGHVGPRQNVRSGTLWH